MGKKIMLNKEDNTLSPFELVVLVLFCRKTDWGNPDAKFIIIGEHYYCGQDSDEWYKFRKYAKKFTVDLPPPNIKIEKYLLGAISRGGDVSNEEHRLHPTLGVESHLL